MAGLTEDDADREKGDRSFSPIEEVRALVREGLTSQEAVQLNFLRARAPEDEQELFGDLFSRLAREHDWADLDPETGRFRSNEGFYIDENGRKSDVLFFEEFLQQADPPPQARRDHDPTHDRAREPRVDKEDISSSGL